MVAFEPHGNSTIEVSGRILVWRANGHMNGEEARRLLPIIRQATAHLGGHPWGILGVVSVPSLLTPDAEHLLHDLHPQFVSAGESAVAIVSNDPSILMMLERQVRRIHSQSNLPVASFASEAEARQWLEQVLDEQLS